MKGLADSKSLDTLPSQIELGKRNNLVANFQGYINSRFVVAFIQYCKEREVWCEVPYDYLLEIDELKIYERNTGRVLLTSCLDFLTKTKRFGCNGKTVWITDEGKNYLLKNYSKRAKKDES